MTDLFYYGNTLQSKQGKVLKRHLNLDKHKTRLVNNNNNNNKLVVSQKKERVHAKY